MATRIDDATRADSTALASEGVQPTLAIVHVGEHADAASYRRTIAQRAPKLGVATRILPLPPDTGADALRQTLRALDDDRSVHGVLVQTPLSPALRRAVGEALDWRKDAEGITPGALGRVLLGEAAVLPCTAAAVVALIESVTPHLRAMRVVIVNNSATVGRPLTHLLLQRHATVTVCASATTDLAEETRRAEILVVAIGHARFFGAAHIAPGTLVIDVGINACPDGPGICGDVDTEAVLDRVAAITPVPGGVGPVTTAMLFANIVRLARLHRG